MILVVGCPWIGAGRTFLWDECSIRGTNVPDEAGLVHQSLAGPV